MTDQQPPMIQLQRKAAPAAAPIALVRKSTEPAAPPSPPRPPLSPSAGQAAAQAARRERAAWLDALQAGRTTLQSLLAYAEGPNGKATHALRLRGVLLASGMNQRQAARVLRRTVEVVGEPGVNLAKVNIGWLVNVSVQGRRLAAFDDALAPRAMPWPGYPLAPKPEGGAA